MRFQKIWPRDPNPPLWIHLSERTDSWARQPPVNDAQAGPGIADRGQRGRGPGSSRRWYQGWAQWWQLRYGLVSISLPLNRLSWRLVGQRLITLWAASACIAACLSCGHGQPHTNSVSGDGQGSSNLKTNGVGPEKRYQLAQSNRQHGKIREAEAQAEDGYMRFRSSNPEWAGRFRILQVQMMMVRGRNSYQAALLALEESPPSDLCVLRPVGPQSDAGGLRIQQNRPRGRIGGEHAASRGSMPASRRCSECRSGKVPRPHQRHLARGGTILSTRAGRCPPAARPFSRVCRSPRHGRCGAGPAAI